MQSMIRDGLQEGYNKLAQELRRGILVLATLSQLDEKKYGYSLITQLSEKGLDIDQGTLYPLLRRLEAQGLLDSIWDVSGSRPRRYYVINEAGEEILKELASDWQALAAVMQNLLA